MEKKQLSHHHNHHHHRSKIRDTVNEILHPDKEYVDYPQITTGDQASARLKDGNKVWFDGRVNVFMQHLVNEISPDVRRELAKGQKPYACILTCADSRLSPELIFDEGLGQLFCVRVAGNIADKLALGSIEYAVEHLKTPLLLVMGHQSCGAVKAALDTVIAESQGKDVHQDNAIGSIIQTIKPVVLHVKETGVDLEKDYQKVFEQCVLDNATLSLRTIIKESKIVREHIENKSLQVAVAEYKIETGEVIFGDFKHE